MSNLLETCVESGKQNGTFLVRESQSHPDTLALCVAHNGGVKELRVERRPLPPHGQTEAKANTSANSNLSVQREEPTYVNSAADLFDAASELQLEYMYVLCGVGSQPLEYKSLDMLVFAHRKSPVATMEGTRLLVLRTIHKIVRFTVYRTCTRICTRTCTPTCLCCAGDMLKLLMPEGTSRVAASDLEERTQRLSRPLHDEKRRTGSGAGPEASHVGGSAAQQRVTGEEDEGPTLQDGFWEVRRCHILVYIYITPTVLVMLQCESS